MMSRISRRGILLAEALIGILVVAVIGAGLLTLGSAGRRCAAGSERHQRATLLGASVMDRIVAEGYAALVLRAGTEEAVDMTDITSESDAPDASVRLEELSAGLLRLEVVLTWKAATSAAGSVTLSFTRYVADPLRGMGGP